MEIYREAVITLLTQFYLDKDAMSVYHGRWDTWLVGNNKMEEFMWLMMKTDDQMNYVIESAKERAKMIMNSPLAKALKEP